MSWNLRIGSRSALVVLMLAGLAPPAQVAGADLRAADVPSCDGQPATIVGTSKSDELSGTAGADVIVGLAGKDFIDGRGGDDVICGGSSPEGGEEQQMLVGGAGRDTLLGGPDEDWIHGGGGNDDIRGRRGSDFLIGDVDKQPGIDRILGGRGSDLLDGWYGGDELHGGRGVDSLTDGHGENVLFGGPGSDYLSSGPFNDELDGGEGRDVVDYTMQLRNSVGGGGGSHCSDVSVDLVTGTGSAEGFGTDQLTLVEGAFTGGGRDTLIGDGSPNFFYPGEPCRSSGHDRYDGAGGSDTISFATTLFMGESGDGPVIVDLAAGSALSRGDEGSARVSFTSVENVDGTSDYRDELLGSSEANVFNGGWTPDHYLGVSGDVIRARGGADVLWGMGGRDSLYGGSGRDWLQGRAGSDRLWGHRGADLLDGGRGRNYNLGGKGRDTCRNPDSGQRTVSCETR